MSWRSRTIWGIIVEMAGPWKAIAAARAASSATSSGGEARPAKEGEGNSQRGDAYSIELTMDSMGSADCLWVETSVLVK